MSAQGPDFSRLDQIRRRGTDSARWRGECKHVIDGLLYALCVGIYGKGRRSFRVCKAHQIAHKTPTPRSAARHRLKMHHKHGAVCISLLGINYG